MSADQEYNQSRFSTDLQIDSVSQTDESLATRRFKKRAVRIIASNLENYINWSKE